MIILSVISVINFLISFFFVMMSNFGCMLYQKGKDVKMLSKSETRNVTMNLYGKWRKMHWYTTLWSTNLCTNVFICHFVILSFLLRRELRRMPTFVELLSGSGHLTVQKWTLALIVGTHFQMVMCLVQFLQEKKLCFLQQKRVYPRI